MYRYNRYQFPNGSLNPDYYSMYRKDARKLFNNFNPNYPVKARTNTYAVQNRAYEMSKFDDWHVYLIDKGGIRISLDTRPGSHRIFSICFDELFTLDFDFDVGFNAKNVVELMKQFVMLVSEKKDIHLRFSLYKTDRGVHAYCTSHPVSFFNERDLLKTVVNLGSNKNHYAYSRSRGFCIRLAPKLTKKSKSELKEIFKNKKLQIDDVGSFKWQYMKDVKINVWGNKHRQNFVAKYLTDIASPIEENGRVLAQPNPKLVNLLKLKDALVSHIAGLYDKYGKIWSGQPYTAQEKENFVKNHGVAMFKKTFGNFTKMKHKQALGRQLDFHCTSKDESNNVAHHKCATETKYYNIPKSGAKTATKRKQIKVPTKPSVCQTRCDCKYAPLDPLLYEKIQKGIMKIYWRFINEGIVNNWRLKHNYIPTSGPANLVINLRSIDLVNKFLLKGKPTRNKLVYLTKEVKNKKIQHVYNLDELKQHFSRTNVYPANAKLKFAGANEIKFINRSVLNELNSTSTNSIDLTQVHSFIDLLKEDDESKNQNNKRFKYPIEALGKLLNGKMKIDYYLLSEYKLKRRLPATQVVTTKIIQDIAPCHLANNTYANENTRRNKVMNYLKNLVLQLKEVIRTFYANLGKRSIKQKYQRKYKQKVLDALEWNIGDRPCLENLIDAISESIVNPVFEWKGKNNVIYWSRNQDQQKYKASVIGPAVGSFLRSLKPKQRREFGQKSRQDQVNTIWDRISSYSLYFAMPNIGYMPAYYKLKGGIKQYVEQFTKDSIGFYLQWANFNNNSSTNYNSNRSYAKPSPEYVPGSPVRTRSRTRTRTPTA